ncbi:hypothetical protein [Bacillus cereus group sp. BfR-BA-01358]|uniref:hypothetical protein n=1 Tax=Bacillus cereus group sp. BfR-BA-01358 TaxID=2920320 RepID=UPI001F55C14D|nr:hypothetical protein [Bacillus cereus group sp. BfR-BA-01358]
MDDCEKKYKKNSREILKRVINFICCILLRILAKITKRKSQIKNWVNNLIEMFGSYSALFGFIGIAVMIVLLVIVFYFSQFKSEVKSDTFWILLNVMVFGVSVFKIKSLLKKQRKFSKKDKHSIKYVYLIFAIYYGICIVISLSKDYIVANYFTTNSPLVIGKYSIEKYTIFKRIWDIMNSFKEAILTVIIFDTAYQMYNFNIIDSQKEYLKQMVKEGRLYVLPEEKDKEHPRIWFIRGDACADIVDDCTRYYFKKNNNYTIKYTKEQAVEIMENRKKLFGEETSNCFYSDDKNEMKYHFYFTLLDFSKIDSKGIDKNEILESIKKELIDLPAEISVKEEKRISERISEWIIDFQSKVNQP